MFLNYLLVTILHNFRLICKLFNMKRLCVLLFLTITLLNDSHACVTFIMNTKDSLIFGWNYEFDCGSGFLIENKKGLTKKSFVSTNENPINWISKYGSITFNQWGKEFPSGGINEMGLVVVQTMFVKTQYPLNDDRLVISELQWIQYQLDNFSTVQEIIDSNKQLRISRNSIPLHFMICDKKGNIAVLEFLDGKMICTRNSDLLYPIMGNDSYPNSLVEIGKYQGYGGNLKIPENSTGPNCGNFIIASDYVKRYNNQQNLIDYSFNILSQSSEQRRTQWSVVFDIMNGDIHFKSLTSKRIKTISLFDFSYDCNTKVKLIDISAKATTDFVSYTNQINSDYIFKAYNCPAISWIKEVVPVEVNENKIKYIEEIKCK